MKSLDRDALEGAKKALLIKDVYFRDEKVVVHPDVTPPFLPEVGRTQFRMTTSILRDFEVNEESAEGDARTSRYLELEFTGYVRCMAHEDEGGDPRELLTSVVSLGLLYFVKGSCSEESLDEFVRMNAPFHAIPYWREHVHAVCCKRRFPLVTVPLYTVLRTSAREAIEKASEEALVESKSSN